MILRNYVTHQIVIERRGLGPTELAIPVQNTTMHVLDGHSKDVLVEGPREVTLEQLVVIDSLRHDTPHKLVVAEVVRVAV